MPALSPYSTRNWLIKVTPNSADTPAGVRRNRIRGSHYGRFLTTGSFVFAMWEALCSKPPNAEKIERAEFLGSPSLRKLSFPVSVPMHNLLKSHSWCRLAVGDGRSGNFAGTVTLSDRQLA